jgi:hypothetical protein
MREGIAMNMIVADVLKKKAVEGGSEAGQLSFIAMFCGIGLLVALCMASLGFDVSGGGIF